MSKQEAHTALSQTVPPVPAPWWVRLCQVLWKAIAFLGTAVFLSAVASLIATWLTNSKGVIPTDSPLRWLLAQWPITVSVGGCLLLIALLTFVLSRWPTHENASPDEQMLDTRRAIEQATSPAHPSPPLSSVARQNRLHLLERVRVTWIEGMLEHSLHQAALIALGLQEQRSTVENPWRLVMQESTLPPRPLAGRARIVKVYDDANGKLLILGEPGAGKTTLLLELTSDLLARSQQDSIYPMPVVFNLSSWTEKRLPLSLWLIEELETKYQVPRKVGTAWVNTGQLSLMLDGLDEVASAYQSACVDTINAYHSEHIFVSIVVCSRQVEYLAQATPIMLDNAVVVQPLTKQQIDDYLLSVGGQVAALRMVLCDDPNLQELAITPLMLSVLTLAYYGKSVDDISALGSSKILQQEVFESYVERMLQRRGAETHYTPHQTIYWLVWLARQMTQHFQTVFYIERTQSSWLPSNWLRRLHYGSAVGLVYGLGYALFFGQSDGLIGGTIDGLAAGLTLGLAYGMLCNLDSKILPVEAKAWSWISIQQYLNKFLENRLVMGLLVGLVGGLLAWLTYNQGRGLGDRLITALFDVPLAMLVYWLPGKLDPEIQPIESATWSWAGTEQYLTKLRENALIIVSTLLYGLAIGLVSWEVYGLSYALIIGVTYGLGTTLIFVLILGSVSGLSNKIVDERNIIRPNQGTWRSGQNALLIGLVTMLIIALITGLQILLAFGLILGPTSGLIVGLLYGLNFGAGCGILLGLRSGGFMCIQHILLRLLLWCIRCTPWNYIRFLNYASERILLRKVGGGYIFVHGLLLDYFALLEKKEP